MGQGESVARSLHDTLCPTHGGQSTAAIADTPVTGTNSEKMQGESVARSLHDTFASTHLRQDEARASSPATTASPSASSTAKKPIHGLLNFELCAGSAGYSAKLFKYGLSTLPIDAPHNKHRQQLPCVTLDLSLPASQELLLKLLADKRIFSIGAAPPCGTSSRARDKKIKNIPASQQPRPLRSQAHPRGLPLALSGQAPFSSTDAARLKQANEIYDFIAHFCSEADAAGVFFWIENPKRSWMWEIEGFRALAAKPGVHMHSLQLCMFGGTRPKWSAFLTNIPEFSGIVRTCDGNHSHAP